MIRNLKALGLALMAALALGAVGAQGASAVVEHSFRADAINEKTVATGSNAGEGSHIFRAATGGPMISCTGVTLSGTYYGNVVDTVTVHPNFTSCTAFGAAAPVSTNGCNFIFDSDTTTNPHFGGEHAAISLECEPGHNISVSSACTVTWRSTQSSNPVNQSLHGVKYTNLSSGQSHSGKSALTANATVGQIHYETSDSGGIACELIGRPDGTYANGIYEGKAIATGYEDTDISPGSTTTTGTTWSHGSQVNISLSTPT